MRTLHPDVLEELAIEKAAREAAKAAAASSDLRSSQVDTLEARMRQVEASLSSAISWKALPAFLLDSFKIFTDQTIEPLRAQVKTLQTELTALKAERGTRYRGVWQNGSEYDLGDFVTYGGAMWHADKPTKNKPGSSDDWTLAVRKGIDGRNGERGPPGPAGRDAGAQDAAK
jgi:hypothetical protein